MEYTEIRNFINSIQDYSDEEILANYKNILWYLNKVESYRLAYSLEILASKTIRNIDKKVRLIHEFFYNENFCNWDAVIKVLENTSYEEKVLIFKKLFNNIKEIEILDLLESMGLN